MKGGGVIILKNFTFLLLDFLRKYLNLVTGWWNSFFKNIITSGITSPVKVQRPLFLFFFREITRNKF